jgi:hypothetical protein
MFVICATKDLENWTNWIDTSNSIIQKVEKLKKKKKHFSSIQFFKKYEENIYLILPQPIKMNQMKKMVLKTKDY